MTPFAATSALWAFWAFSWIAAAVWTRTTAARGSIANAVTYRLPIVVGYGSMLAGARAPGVAAYAGFGERLWPSSEPLDWAITGLVAIGFAFTWWARFTLGGFWSGSITRKEGHHVIDTGPYAVVRHPIYTGLLLATLATALEIGTLSAVIGAGLVTFGYWLKAGFEERFLAEQLGEAAYADYRRRIPMLTPFWPHGR